MFTARYELGLISDRFDFVHNGLNLKDFSKVVFHLAAFLLVPRTCADGMWRTANRYSSWLLAKAVGEIPYRHYASETEPPWV